MNMTHWLKRYGVLFGTLLLLCNTAAVAQDEIVASLDRVTGTVEVTDAATRRTVQGRNGLLLRMGDLVVTKDAAKATVKFRDGSEIRLFSNTSFLVEGAKESASGERSFKFNLFVKVGSVWANFVRQRQVAQINTPTATMGIKGTTLRVVERDDRARVAVTEGVVAVSNDRASVDLPAGKRLPDFTRSVELAPLVQDIPYKLDVKSETRELNFEGNRPAEAFLSIQLIDLKSGGNVARSGAIYLRSNYDRITYPQAAQLDARGFARVPLIFAPPDASHANLDGNIYVWAVLDAEDADDTGEGRYLFKFTIPQTTERYEIESETGEGRRRN
jgi:hypothetical protein